MRLKASLASRLQCVLLLLVVARTAAAGGIIYVDADAPGANNGSSWENAYVFLQDGLADAETADKPVEIRMAKGIYTPDQGFWRISGDKRTYFRLINEVAIIGGFAGLSEADPNARDIECYKTILSGDLEGNDAEVDDPGDMGGDPTRADNCRHVVGGSNTNATAVLDGLTITGGHSTMIGIDSLFGGAGMIIYSGNPTLINCIFTCNSASQVGGGLRNSGGSPTLIGCTFSKNKGGRGGGMFNYNNSNPTLTNCIFHNNVARSNGGGIYNHNSNSTLTNCILSMNTAQGQEGGMHNIFHSNPIVTNCIFRYNRAHSSGGGMYNKESSPMVANCIFEGNSTTERTAWYLYKGGGGIYNYSKCSPTLINCTFAGNSAISGNTLACDSSQQNNPSNIGLTNCILWDGGDEISNVDGSIININYSTSKALWPGEGNIDVDPCFTDPGYWADADDPNIVVEPNNPNAIWVDGDYHLKSQTGRLDPTSESWVQDNVTSPCIDVGDPNSPVAFEPFPNGGIINMGAYGGSSQASKSPSGLHAKYGGGTGEPNDPYLIYTAEHLNVLGADSNDYDKHFKLMADIDLDPNLPGRKVFNRAVIAPDMNDTDFYYDFQGIPFSGIFNGNGHTISHLTIEGISNLGLFGQLHEQAVVSNVGLAAVNVNGVYGVGAIVGDNFGGNIATSYSNGSVKGNWFVGGLVGNNSVGSITGCCSTGVVTGKGDVGGLVGNNGDAERSIAVLTNCYSTATVSGGHRVGGLAGSNYYKGSIATSYSTGEVTGKVDVGGLVGSNFGNMVMSCSTGRVSGDETVGGLVGYNTGGSIMTSYSRGSVTGNWSVGGLVGWSYNGNITTSYSRGIVTGNWLVGGLVGYNAESIIKNNYSSSEVTGHGYIGGLIGCNEDSNITMSHSSGVVTGNEDVGGLVGYNWLSSSDAGSMTFSFWDMESSGQTTSAGGEGKTTVEMQTAITFLEAGWDFVGETENGSEDIWWILEGQDYPRLWWETIPEK